MTINKLEIMKTTKLENLNACEEAVRWVKTQKSISQAWLNCERGDWMLWLAKKLDVNDKKLTLAKVMCAKQVEHLMKDQRSKDALQACFDYINGEITREQLNNVAYAAYTAAACTAAVKRTSLKKSADICREYLTDEVLKTYKKWKLQKQRKN